MVQARIVNQRKQHKVRPSASQGKRHALCRTTEQQAQNANPIHLVYHAMENREDSQRLLNAAFDILFDEVERQLLSSKSDPE